MKFIQAFIFIVAAMMFAPTNSQAKYCDNESDLVYYGYRYYSPLHGRWLSRDPIQEKGGINLYAYVRNNSVNCLDPLGKTSSTDQAASGAIASGLAGAGAANYGAIIDQAEQAVQEVQLEADATMAVVESDSDAVLNTVTKVVANLKDYVVAIGRINTGDQATAKALGYGVINVQGSPPWTSQMNSMIMQGLIDQGNSFYISSAINVNNMWNETGQMSITGQELFQLFDAGYGQHGYDMIPP